MVNYRDMVAIPQRTAWYVKTVPPGTRNRKPAPGFASEAGNSERSFLAPGNLFDKIARSSRGIAKIGIGISDSGANSSTLARTLVV